MDDTTNAMGWGDDWWPELLELVDCLEMEAARAGGRPSRAVAEVCREIDLRLALFRAPEVGN